VITQHNTKLFTLTDQSAKGCRLFTINYLSKRHIIVQFRSWYIYFS